MKFFHISDLHLGKRLNEFSLIEDQEYILSEIVKAAEKERPDGIFIAGDIYDKSMPSAEAVGLFDRFLFSLSALNIKVFVISGNHDSPERIAFGGRLMEKSGVYLSPVYSGETKPISFENIDIYMLPFIKPAAVRKFFPEAESYEDAVISAISKMELNPEKINILITHQFVVGAALSDSEEISVGGTDSISGEVFKDFSYVALGHIHSPQTVLREGIRYSGTPLKYSFSECGQNKSITVLDIDEKIKISTITLKPLRDLREKKGKYEDKTNRENYKFENREDYIHITLTDEEEVTEALGKLRVIYPNIMKLSYDNTRTKTAAHIDFTETAEAKSPIELFSELYEKQNGREITEKQIEFIKTLLEKEDNL